MTNVAYLKQTKEESSIKTEYGFQLNSRTKPANGLVGSCTALSRAAFAQFSCLTGTEIRLSCNRRFKHLVQVRLLVGIG